MCVRLGCVLTSADCVCVYVQAIGDAALETKFTTASTKIKRDIVFAASLYY